MGDELKNFWKKPLTGWRGMLVVAATTTAFMAVLCSVYLMATGTPISRAEDELKMFGLMALLFLLIFPVMFLVQALSRWMTFKKLCAVVGGTVLLFVLIHIVEDWRGWHAWTKFKREWEAKGESFDRNAFVPRPVADEKNFAMALIVFTSYGQTLTKDGKVIPQEKRDINFINRLNMDASDQSLEEPTNGVGDRTKATLTDLRLWQDYYRTLAKTTNLFAVPAQPVSPAADVLLALGKHDAAIEELREAGQRPASRFPLNYETENPAAILLPHLASLKNAVLTLKLRSIAELQSGQLEKALEDIHLALRLTDSIRTEPFLISHLVRIGQVQIILQPIYEGLAGQRWADSQLARLELELSRLNFLEDYQLAMRGELTLCQVGIFDFARRHPEALLPTCILTMDGSRPSAFGDWLAKTAVHLIPSGWLYQNQVRCVRMMLDGFIPAADIPNFTVSPTKVRQAIDILDKETETATPYNFLERLLLPGLGNSIKKFSFAQTSVDLARVAVALERYRLARGNYPESLAALAPQFIPVLPHDVIGGGPLKYRHEADGSFTLYSVGWNEADDGGVVVFKESSPDRVDIDKGDWVWRYPVQ